MPRKLRIEYPRATYRVMSRANRRQKIFLDDLDRQDFIKTLAEACGGVGPREVTLPSRPAGEPCPLEVER